MNLYGWDVASALSLERANAELHGISDDLMQVFSYQEGGATVAGRFMDWQLVPGGSGSSVRLEVPFQMGYLTGMGPDKLGEPQPSLAGVVVTLEVPLQLVKTDVAQSDLKFHFGQLVDELSTIAVNPAHGDFTLKGVTDRSDTLTPTQLRGVGTLVARGLEKHADEIDHVFARVGGAAAVKGFPSPTASAFAYTEVGPDDQSTTGYLVVMGMLDGGDASGNQVEFDSELLDGFPEAVVAMSEEVFLRYLVMPMLPSLVGHGTSAGSFRWDEGRWAVVTTGSIGLDSVEPALITYYPQMDSMVMQVVGQQLTTSIQGSCDLKLGLRMTWSMSLADAMTYNPSLSAATFTQVGSPQVSYTLPPVTPDQSSWLTAFTNNGITWMLKGVANAVETAVASSVRNGLADRLGGIRLQQSPPVPIVWAGASAMKVTGVTLDDSLLVTASAA